MLIRAYVTTACFIASLLASVSVIAVDYGYSVFARRSYTDNLFQTEDRESGSTSTAGLQFSFQSQDNPSLTADVSGLVGKTWYSQDVDDRPVRGLVGNALFRPVGSNFSVAFLDSYSQVPRNRFVTESIDNYQDINVIAVMPRYFINLGSSADRFVFEYMYSRVNDSDENDALVDDDSSRSINRPTVGYERLLSSTTQIGLLARGGKVRYDELDINYDEKSQFLRWSTDYGLTQFQLDVGKSEIEAISGTQDQETDLIEFSLSRIINSNNSLSLNYRDGFGDVLDLDLSNEGVDFDVNGLAAFLNEVVEEKRTSLTLNHTGFDFNGRVSISDSKIKGIDTNREETGLGATLYGSYELGRLLNTSLGSNVTFQYEYRESEFVDRALETKASISSIRFNHYTSENLLVYLEYRYRKTERTQVVNMLESSSEVGENIAVIGLSYSPRGKYEGF